MMRNLLARWLVLTLGISLALIVCFSEAQAQQRRRRPSRRITHPVRSQPVPLPASASPQSGTEATIISTADEPPPETKSTGNTTKEQIGRTPRTNATKTNTEQEQMRRTIDQLTNQVTRLTERLEEMRDQQSAMVNLERLTRAEQRAENLRSQLRDVIDKEAAFQARLEQIEYELRPESIQMRAAVVGTLRPDEVREAIRRQLENERTRVRAQLDQLATSRVRLEAAIATADTEVDRLRARLDAADKAQAGSGANANSTLATPTPASPPPSSPDNSIPY